MHIAINKKGEIVAFDKAFAEKFGVHSVSELYMLLAENAFTKEGERFLVREGERSVSYRCEEVNAYIGFFGEIALCRLMQEREESEAEVQEIEESTESEFEEILMPLELKEEGLESIKTEEAIEEPEVQSQDEDERIELPEAVSEEQARYEDTLSVVERREEKSAPSEAELLVKEDEKVESQVPPRAEPIFVDFLQKSQEIGISLDEYRDLFCEYARSAMEKEEMLKSSDPLQRQAAVSELEHLGHLLRIDLLVEPLERIVETDDDEIRESVVRSFYETLASLQSSEEERQTDLSHATTPEVTSEATPEAAHIVEREDRVEEEPLLMREPIALDDVAPEHFDFKVEDAARDLNLPKELIEEFVIDFIEQAKSETPRILLAYQQGDLETVQKIGHLLKGAASNLRIEPLAQSLYDIQFNDDIERVPELVRRYWAKFIAFDAQMQAHRQSKA